MIRHDQAPLPPPAYRQIRPCLIGVLRKKRENRALAIAASGGRRGTISRTQNSSTTLGAAKAQAETAFSEGALALIQRRCPDHAREFPHASKVSRLTRHTPISGHRPLLRVIGLVGTAPFYADARQISRLNLRPVLVAGKRFDAAGLGVSGPWQRPRRNIFDQIGAVGCRIRARRVE